MLTIKMRELKPKVSLIMRIYVWFYRIIGITFGGLAFNEEGKLYANRYLKYFGHFTAIFITIVNISGFIYVMESPQVIEVYNSGQITRYVSGALINGLQVFHVLVNLWYLNRNGIKFLNTFYDYGMRIGKNQILLFVIWTLHILIPVLAHSYILYSSKISKTSNTLFVFIITMFRIFGFLTIWIVSFLTWVISIHFYELLTDIKRDINQQINRTTGIV